MHRVRNLRPAGLLRTLAVAGIAAVSAAYAASDAATTPEARYQQERSACLSGQSAEDRATCLREAGAALQQAKRGALGNGSDYERNAMERCKALPDADRADCVSRVKGEGAKSGSVSGGGILKETVTVEPVSKP